MFSCQPQRSIVTKLNSNIDQMVSQSRSLNLGSVQQRTAPMGGYL